MTIYRPLVAGEDSGDQFAEIVDLLGPPQTDIMEAMGVEDAVRDILVFSNFIFLVFSNMPSRFSQGEKVNSYSNGQNLSQ